MAEDRRREYSVITNQICSVCHGNKGKIRTQEVKDRISNSLKGRFLGKESPNYIPIEKRFKTNFIINNITGCWEWKGAKDGQGYGHIRNEGKTEKAHRISYKLNNGKIPSGLFVLHSCDNPSCVNPDHLFLGTQKDNMADMRRKNRQKYNLGPKGTTCYSAKLTEKQVVEIRSKYKSGGVMSARMLSKIYGVARTTVEAIIYRRTWKHI